MPWRNRVNPFGEFEAVPERGLLMGNRGCLINRNREIVRPFQLQRWISCVLEFKERKRPLMTPGRWTELFFLDEATALAAGHRPCFECRRSEARRFLHLWNEANNRKVRYYPDLDKYLREERLKQNEALTFASGLIVAAANTPYLYLNGLFYRWTPAGYDKPLKIGENLRQITPPSIARTLAAGYLPIIHPSAINPSL